MCYIPIISVRLTISTHTHRYTHMGIHTCAHACVGVCICVQDLLTIAQPCIIFRSSGGKVILKLLGSGVAVERISSASGNLVILEGWA